MYHINKESNKIEPMVLKTFSELGFTERSHLQEWLAKMPRALGEDLLIIQKEFNEFDGTRERLDLLALDKNGRLVLIENKLDDSGRDVVWQALKYASYCSGLKKDQIVEIFQRYLTLKEGGGDAKKLLSEFFEGREFDELILNPGNEQRVILVAANFRKEVTSTALWLLGYNLRLQCIKVTPFERSGQLYLEIDQIIPTPEIATYMIGLAEKQASQQADEAEVKDLKCLRLDFWTQALKAVRESTCRLFDNVNPSTRQKAATGAGIGSIWYEMVFGFSEVRVDLYLDFSDSHKNKEIFDDLKSQQKQIELQFGDVLEWNRMEGRKGAQIQYVTRFDGRDVGEWPNIIAWLVRHIEKLESALKEPLKTLQRKDSAPRR